MVQTNSLCRWVFKQRKCLCNQNIGSSVFLVMDYDIPMSIEQCRAKLREEFTKNKDVSDIRVIDMLVVKVSCFLLNLIKTLSFTFNGFDFRDKWNWRRPYRSGNRRDTLCATGKSRKIPNLQISYQSSSMDKIDLIRFSPTIERFCYKF